MCDKMVDGSKKTGFTEVIGNGVCEQCKEIKDENSSH